MLLQLLWIFVCLSVDLLAQPFPQTRVARFHMAKYRRLLLSIGQSKPRSAQCDYKYNSIQGFTTGLLIKYWQCILLKFLQNKNEKPVIESVKSLRLSLNQVNLNV